MRPLVKNSTWIFVFILFVYTCAKESEETTPDTPVPENTHIEKPDVPKAKADWQKFNTTADKLLAISATNLKSLLAKSKKSQSKAAQDSYANNYSQYEKQYRTLKDRLAQQNLAFSHDLNDYSAERAQYYSQFKNLLLHDLLELNNDLEDLLEENTLNGL